MIGRHLGNCLKYCVVPSHRPMFGYSGLTGRSVVILGALNQYGLVENTTKGHMKVSKLAADILHGYPEGVRLEALCKSGHEPALFRAIFDKFDNHIPSDNAVRSFLINSGFTNDGAEKALKTFLETNRFLEIKGACESYSDAPESVAESTPDKPTQEQKHMEHSLSPQVREMTNAGAPIFWNSGPIDFNLSSGGLAVAGMTNSAKELRAYIAKLTALAALLPDDEPTER